ncbi:hypothetical protein RJT34_01298 [Clitoria ternatea]|uniref:Uncharacterized protein n=1 Tax=Clitoria ternatea TaxID=43366 RepID=A0AAN9PYG5_CLITE
MALPGSAQLTQFPFHQLHHALHPHSPLHFHSNGSHSPKRPSAREIHIHIHGFQRHFAMKKLGHSNSSYHALDRTIQTFVVFFFFLYNFPRRHYSMQIQQLIN